MSMSLGRLACALVVTVMTGAALLAGSASPAGAVAVRPTNMRSTVQSIEPAAPIEVRIIGGDALVELTAEPGHTVIVEGYNGEPYLRISPDGTVATNRRSPATALNQTRDPGSVPADASSTAPPDWEVTGSGGRVLWHDHRIHAAAVTRPIAWTLALTVDGTPTAVRGELRRLDPPSPLPWVALTVATAGGAYWVGRHRPRGAAVAAVLIASALALATGWAEWASVPTGAGRNVGLVALPVAAAVLAAASLPLRRATVRLVLVLGAVSLLSGWLAFRWSILTRSVLVSDLAPAVDRAALAVVMGLVLAAAGLSVGAAGQDRAPVRSTLASGA